jgi:hypothetical protein
VGVVEGRDRASFLFEASAAVRVGGYVLGQDLDGDDVIEAGVAGFVDLAHTAGPNGGKDLVRAKPGAGREGHGWTAGIVAPEGSRLPPPPAHDSGGLRRGLAVALRAKAGKASGRRQG